MWRTRLQWVQTPMAAVGTTILEQTSQVSGRLGRIRESWWAGIVSRAA